MLIDFVSGLVRSRTVVAGILLLTLFATSATAQGDSSPRALGDRAAEKIRAAAAADRIPERNALIDEALALLDRAMAHPEADAQSLQRSRYDRLLALRTRESMEEAVSAWESLEADGLEPPVYVTVAAADAYLYLRCPEQAEALYERVLERQPGRLETLQSLFWARLEQEDFSGALATIDSLVEHPEVASGSRLHRDGRITAAMGRGYANRLEEAIVRLEALAADHPKSGAATRSLATIYRWRGWSRRALELIEPLLAQTTESTDLRLLHAALLRDLGRYREAGRILESLYETHPQDRHVQRGWADWRTRDRWSYWSHGEYGESDGVREFGSRDRAWRMRLSAPWVGSYLQPYLRSEYSHATFPEGEAEYDRIGLGLDYRRAGHRVNLEFHRNRRGADEAGLTAAWDWQLDDQWSLATRYESFSTDVPLRARGQGLDGWKTEAAVRWQAHESLNLRLGVSRLAISDGNERDAVLVSLGHRPHVSAHHTTDGTLDLYAARASQTGGPYYNPEEDASLAYVIQHDWLTWRRYEHSLTQRFVLGGGAYWQKHYGTHAIGLARYEHLWQVSQHWFVHYGVGISSRVYDGDRESRVDGQLWLRGVF
ncbi:poly-beta-1,6 N-acetyl-D-glucosamine export porin PgaA [Wenzhouxiangella sediminis]|uniref:Poly-beta-1,6 N-acetyl-D-glucosamine export porin PgaA n=1 Tax=Wenzhouxiangella sediminis TaxID=1792836 RepID=A0A3E1K6T1_9GAMM|nr:poly-beta-1,6 N-acetyl-D-glucosamine export porin PgaA [Wenzhouxiangella sediminis]